jgi:UDP-N-acetyl-D-mannosaminuronic acid dehydrogenase
MFAAYGKNVIGVDVNQHEVDTINRGEIHIVEPDLDAIVHKAVTEGKLKTVLSPEPADAIFNSVESNQN